MSHETTLAPQMSLYIKPDMKRYVRNYLLQHQPVSRLSTKQQDALILYTASRMAEVNLKLSFARKYKNEIKQAQARMRDVVKASGAPLNPMPINVPALYSHNLCRDRQPFKAGGECMPGA
jgi:hypothetical protein